MDSFDRPGPATIRPLPRFAPIAVVLTAAVAFALYIGWAVRHDPEVVMLLPRGGAEWITAPRETTLAAIPPGTAVTIFRADLPPDAAAERSTLRVAAFRGLEVVLDGAPLAGDGPAPLHWKQERVFQLPTSLRPGRHTLLFAVFNDRGPPALRVSAVSPGLRSGPDWQCTTDGKNWTEVSPVTRIQTPQFSATFPAPIDQLRSVWPILAIVCVGAAAISWRAGKDGTRANRLAGLVTPSRLRVAIVAALLVLGWHTMSRANLLIGADAPDHYRYIDWCTEHVGVPPVDGGRQFFQAPLFYWTGGVAHRLFGLVMPHDRVHRALRLIPILCGLALVELIYRTLRHAFPGRDDVRRAGLLAASFVPMLIFMTQFAGNEPMAAAFGAGAVLVMLRLVKLQRTAGPPAFGAAGLLWGLAVLSKVSALLLGPAFALALAFWCYSSRPGIKAAAARLFPFAVAFLLTCGWFFALNYARYGRAFVGGWSPETGYLWWQLPGYRTPQQYLSFGRALAHPVFASVYGFWDAMYAGLWFDSNQGGIIQRGFHPKWAYRFAESALLWAAIPTIAILAGSIRAVLPRRRVHPTDASRSHAHFTLVLSLCVIGSYGAAILGHSLLVPYYSVLKASYALAALPSLAVLIAAGFEPLMRYRTTRALLHAWIAGWVVLVYAGYWVRGP